MALSLTKCQTLRLRLGFLWEDARDWCLRWIYAQHNARVITDFEHRMRMVIWDATGGLMSKPYYTLEAMRAEIAAHLSAQYEDAYAEGRKDAFEEMGLPDPSPVTPETASNGGRFGQGLHQVDEPVAEAVDE